MDIKIIEEMIEELKDSDTTYANVADLASLYIVKDRLNQSNDKTITLGSMALAQTSSYMATGSMVPYTSAEVTAGITW